MKKFFINVFNTVQQGCSNIIEKPSKIFLLVFWISWIIFILTQYNDATALEAQINQENQSLRSVASTIVETKDFDIELSDVLTSYKIEETKNYYYVRLNGTQLNYVKLTFDKEFVLVNQSTVSNLWIIALLCYILIWVATYFILYFIIFILFIISSTIITKITKKTKKDEKDEKLENLDDDIKDTEKKLEEI